MKPPDTRMPNWTQDRRCGIPSRNQLSNSFVESDFHANRTRAVAFQGVAAAPVSFGVFGESVAGESPGGEAEAVIAAIAAAGFDGTELGPPRFFGAPDSIRERLGRHALRLVGAYIPLHLADPDRRDEDLLSLRLTLEELAVDRRSLAILADWGTAALMANPARPWGDRAMALDRRAWRSAVATIRQAIDVAGEYGIATTFHPHIATYVESPWEIDRLLEDIDIGLTIDTGHIFLAGASPSDLLRQWTDRVDHVHLKDVRRVVMDRAKADGRHDLETWWADVSCPLGEGDVDLEGFLSGLREAGYRGWLVVEQDRAPARLGEFAAIVQEQARNVRWVREHLTPGEVLPASERTRKA